MKWCVKASVKPKAPSRKRARQQRWSPAVFAQTICPVSCDGVKRGQTETEVVEHSAGQRQSHMSLPLTLQLDCFWTQLVRHTGPNDPEPRSRTEPASCVHALISRARVLGVFEPLCLPEPPAGLGRTVLLFMVACVWVDNVAQTAHRDPLNKPYSICLPHIRKQLNSLVGRVVGWQAAD